MEGVHFDDRLALFAAVVALAREVRILEGFTLLAGWESPRSEGRSLKRLAGPISRKSLEHAAQSRRDFWHRKFPGGTSEMGPWMQERAERMNAQVTADADEKASSEGTDGFV